MHIALCHDAVIPPRTYGGTERVIYWLAQALNTLGHRTTLIARAGSHIPNVPLIVMRRSASFDDLLPSDVDIAHLWATPRTRPRKPFLVTIEGNGAPGETFHPNTVFISKSHANLHGSNHFVYNGVAANDYECRDSRDDYVVFLAKASWKVKNLRGAIDVARAAGLRLEVLGSRDLPFNFHKLLPTIRGVRYRGMVNDLEKRQLLSRARALLFPVRWPEPFGVAVVEALLSGCPVLATPYGALPEIITPDVGLLTTSGDEMVKALRDPLRFEPRRCRNHAIDRFSDLDMARSYLAYYEQITRHGSLDSDRLIPQILSEASTDKLLPWTEPRR